MGRTSKFIGEIGISPALSAEEINYLKQFNRTRHTQLLPSPYAVGDFEPEDLRNADPDLIMKNSYPPEGQPGLWCNWIPADDGTAIKWDGAEKSHDMAEWLVYLVEHFIGRAPLAKAELPFFVGHELNGEVEVVGEPVHDRQKIVVTNSRVRVLEGSTVYGDLDDLLFIFGSALRYGLGRQTYAVGLISKFIRNNLKLLNQKWLVNLLEDMKGYEKDRANGRIHDSACDYDEWTKLRIALKEEYLRQGLDPNLPHFRLDEH